MPSLGSHDYVDQAVEVLDDGPFQFFLITGTHTDYTRLDSSLNQDAREMLLDWVRSGRFEEMLVEHYERNPIKRHDA